MPRYVVTGASGFIGMHLVRHLRLEGAEVLCLGRSTRNADTIERTGASLVVTAFDKPEPIKRHLRPGDVLFHLAGGGIVSTSTDDGLSRLLADNVALTETLIEACRTICPGRIVVFSSISSMGVVLDRELDESQPLKPSTPHEVAKARVEEACLRAVADWRAPVVILRPSQVYGPGDVQSEIPKLARLVKRGVVPLFGGGKGEVPWVYVDDVVDAALLASNKPVEAGEAFIISDRRSYPFSEVVSTMAELLGRRRGGIPIPESLARPLIGLQERMMMRVGREPLFTTHRLDSICGSRRVSIDKAIRVLGFDPKIGLREGMSRTLESYRSLGFI